MKGLEIALEDLLEALLARCHDTTAVLCLTRSRTRPICCGQGYHWFMKTYQRFMMRKGAMSS